MVRGRPPGGSAFSCGGATTSAPMWGEAGGARRSCPSRRPGTVRPRAAARQRAAAGRDSKAMRATSALLLTCLAGCGYLGSGTWDDDAKNWGRAFASELPAAAVVHSRYTRFAHFTYEYEYFFQLGPNADLSRQILQDDTLVRIRPNEGAWLRTSETPQWFAPRPPHAYDVYALAAEPGRDFRILVDRRTRELFLMDRRL